VFDNGALLIMFHLENALQTNCSVTAGKIHQLPGAVLLDGPHFLLHGLEPALLALGLLKRGRLPITNGHHQFPTNCSLLCFPQWSSASGKNVLQLSEA
jgi:hypothetical protein